MSPRCANAARSQSVWSKPCGLAPGSEPKASEIAHFVKPGTIHSPSLLKRLVIDAASAVSATQWPVSIAVVVHERAVHVGNPDRNTRASSGSLDYGGGDFGGHRSFDVDPE